MLSRVKRPDSRVAVALLVLVAGGLLQAAADIGTFRHPLIGIIGLALAVSAGWIISARNMKRMVESESRRFATLLDAAPEVIIGVGDDGLIRFANSRVTELLGYAHTEIVGQPVELLIPERLRSNHVVTRNRYIQEPQRRPMGTGMTLIARRSDGTEVPVEISLNRIETHKGHVALCIVRDVTEQTRTRQALEDANEKLKVSLAEAGRRAEELRLLSHMAELLQCCVSEREAYAVISKCLARLLPDTAGGLYLLNSSRNLVELIAPWNQESTTVPAFDPQTCWALRRGRVHITRDKDSVTRCDHPMVEGEGHAICLPMSAHGDLIGVLCVRAPLGNKAHRRALRQLLHAAAEQVALAIASLRLRDTLRVQSTRDPLTGLYNRRFLDECLEREVHASLRTRSALSLLMLDLDHFKRFNDTFGHQCGDHALRDVATLINDSVRRSDIVCRFGGEELVVLLPSTSCEQAAQIAENLRREVQQLVTNHNEQTLGGLTVSIGIASCPEHATSVTELLRAADMALYASKRSGRNRVVIASRPETLTESTVDAQSSGNTHLLRALPGAAIRR